MPAENAIGVPNAWIARPRADADRRRRSAPPMRRHHDRFGEELLQDVALRAPVAMRMPISRVRSVTLTSMMFMTPMPPTSSEIAAIEPSRIVSVFCVVGRRLQQRGHVADLEIRACGGAPRAASRPLPASRRSASSVVDRDRDRCAGTAGRTGAACRSCSGTNTDVVLVVALRRARPSAAITPITWNGTLLIRTYWPIGSLPSGNSVFDDASGPAPRPARSCASSPRVKKTAARDRPVARDRERSASSR